MTVWNKTAEEDIEMCKTTGGREKMDRDRLLTISPGAGIRGLRMKPEEASSKIKVKRWFFISHTWVSSPPGSRAAGTAELWWQLGLCSPGLQQPGYSWHSKFPPSRHAMSFSALLRTYILPLMLFIHVTWLKESKALRLRSVLKPEDLQGWMGEILRAWKHLHWFQ